MDTHESQKSKKLTNDQLVSRLVFAASYPDPVKANLDKFKQDIRTQRNLGGMRGNQVIATLEATSDTFPCGNVPLFAMRYFLEKAGFTAEKSDGSTDRLDLGVLKDAVRLHKMLVKKIPDIDTRLANVNALLNPGVDITADIKLEPKQPTFSLAEVETLLGSELSPDSAGYKRIIKQLKALAARKNENTPV